MTTRRTFLTRSGLALGALIVGDEAIEALVRLTHVRKSFPSAGMPMTQEQRSQAFMNQLRDIAIQDIQFMRRRLEVHLSFHPS